MKVEIIFEKPRDITTPGLDGTVIRYPFAVRYIGEGALQDEISHHSVDVSISGTLSSMWGFGRFGDPGDALLKTLFQFGLQHINDKLQAGELEDNERFDLRTNTAPSTNPFHPSKIPSPAGFTSQIEIIEEQASLPDLPPTMKQPVASEVPVEIQQSLQRFREDHPDPEKAAFLMMQFSKTNSPCRFWRFEGRTCS